jgi:hypothetical protein
MKLEIKLILANKILSPVLLFVYHPQVDRVATQHPGSQCQSQGGAADNMKKNVLNVKGPTRTGL